MLEKKSDTRHLMMSLEQRIMFDGAAMVEVVDQLVESEGSDTAADDSQSQNENSETSEKTLPNPEAIFNDDTLEDAVNQDDTDTLNASEQENTTDQNSQNESLDTNALENTLNPQENVSEQGNQDSGQNTLNEQAENNDNFIQVTDTETNQPTTDVNETPENSSEAGENLKGFGGLGIAENADGSIGEEAIDGEQSDADQGSRVVSETNNDTNENDFIDVVPVAVNDNQITNFFDSFEILLPVNSSPLMITSENLSTTQIDTSFDQNQLLVEATLVTAPVMVKSVTETSNSNSFIKNTAYKPGIENNEKSFSQENLSDASGLKTVLADAKDFVTENPEAAGAAAFIVVTKAAITATDLMTTSVKPYQATLNNNEDESKGNFIISLGMKIEKSLNKETVFSSQQKLSDASLLMVALEKGQSTVKSSLKTSSPDTPAYSAADLNLTHKLENEQNNHFDQQEKLCSLFA